MSVLSVCLSTFEAHFSSFISRFCDYIKDRTFFKSFDFSCFRAFYKKSLAFTLAETLVVMGIIGVVAALTIPNLSKSTGNAEKVARAKKFYAELNEAHNRATAVYGPIESWSGGDSSASKRYYDRITEFMKLQKECRDSANNCMPATTKFLGGSSADNMNYNYSAILAGGGAFHIRDFSYSQCNGESEGYTNYCGKLWVDVDGPQKGKNTYGHDLFWICITKDGLKPCGNNRPSDALSNNTWISGKFNSGRGALEWILRYDNMDYINCSVSTTKTSCK